MHNKEKVLYMPSTPLNLLISVAHVGLIRDDLHCAPCYLYKFKDQCPYNLECMSGIDSKRVLDAIDTFSKSDELDATSK